MLLVYFVDTVLTICFLNIRVHIFDTDLWFYYVKIKNFQEYKILNLSHMCTLKEEVSFIFETLTPNPHLIPWRLPLYHCNHISVRLEWVSVC